MSDLIGKVFDTLNFGKLKILEYNNSSSVKVEFIETGTKKVTTMGNIRKGRVRDDSKPLYKLSYSVGDVFSTKESGDVEIIKISSSRSVLVKFIDTGNTRNALPASIKSGYLKDRERPEICGVGFIGYGNYKSNGSHVEAYNHWTNMLRRCYDRKCDSYHVYGNLGVRVDPEWHNYQSFAEWFFDNRPENLDIVYLDKDIKGSGRKIYSPETCSLVSASENNQEVVTRKFGKFKLLSPDGNVVEFANQTKFAEANQLNQTCISNIINGKQESHKGWKKAPSKEKMKGYSDEG